MSRWETVESTAERGWKMKALRWSVLGALGFAAAGFAGLYAGLPGVGWSALGGAAICVAVWRFGRA